MDNIEKSKKGISGSTLKIIAIVTMFIDHVGATIVQRELYNGYSVMAIGIIMRLIGRLAFPIFCFLLVEGFLHTSNIKKYATRLFLFALFSEIPFDFAFYKAFFAWEHQNVFFTLFIGILVMFGVDFVRKKYKENKSLRTLLVSLVIVVGMVVAELIKCDYASLGILVILVLYLFHDLKSIGSVLVCTIFIAYCISPAIAMYNELEIYGFRATNLYGYVCYMLISVLQAYASLAFIPIHFYNGEKGLSLKYFFYAFYPVHLLLLGIIVNYIM